MYHKNARAIIGAMASVPALSQSSRRLVPAGLLPGTGSTVSGKPSRQPSTAVFSCSCFAKGALSVPQVQHWTPPCGRRLAIARQLPEFSSSSFSSWALWHALADHRLLNTSARFRARSKNSTGWLFRLSAEDVKLHVLPPSRLIMRSCARLLGECIAFLASGSDPTVMHCCKIANGKEQGVSRFLYRSPTCFLVISHTGSVHHVRVQCLEKLQTAKSKASLVFFTGLRHVSWLFHTLEACTMYVYNVWKACLLLSATS